jgi:general L-amino acid transport system substrate-binding protein
MKLTSAGYGATPLARYSHGEEAFCGLGCAQVRPAVHNECGAQTPIQEPGKQKRLLSMKKTIVTAAIAAATLGVAAQGASAATLDDVKAKGFIQCGVSQGLPGFSNPDAAGNWTGLDVDFCRAMASAIFGDPSKVKYTPLSAKERFTALQSGEVDVLPRNTTWTMSRDTTLGLNFAGVNYYDGQGFMVRSSLGVKSALELSGASVCTNTGTTTELNVADYFRANKMEYEIVAFEKADEVVAAYDAGRCDVYTTDQSGLYAQRLKLTNPGEHVVLQEIISKEPLGPVVRQGDDQWFDLAKWTHNAMLVAEELGVTKANVDEMLNSENPEIKRLLGKEGEFGAALGVGNDWAYQIVKNVGNYAEIFDANVGPDTPLGIARGLNAQWNKGGLQYAPPIR